MDTTNKPNLLNHHNQDSFFRSVIVGCQSYLFDSLFIPVADKTGEVSMSHVPIYYSIAGQFDTLISLFMDSDKYCDVLKVDGNVNKVPAGVLYLDGGVQVVSADRLSQYSMFNYTKEFNEGFGPVGVQMASNVNMLPIELSFKVKFRCSTESQRLKVIEYFIKTYYPYGKFWIRYDGFEGIPCLMSYSDSYGASKSFTFLPGKDDLYETEAGFSLYTHMPIIDRHDERFNSNRIDDPRMLYTTRK